MQVALIMIALVTLIAIPMIFLRGSQPAAKALLLRNLRADLLVIIGILAIVSLILYACEATVTGGTRPAPRLGRRKVGGQPTASMLEARRWRSWIGARPISSSRRQCLRRPGRCSPMLSGRGSG